jgi:hypothetical protein
MSGVRTYQSLRNLVTRLRDDLNNPTKPTQLVLVYAYNRTGKTRLSMEFKDVGKRKNNGNADTLYFNAYTEDLFVWENDLEADSSRYLQLNPDSSFFNGLKDLALDETIAGYLSRYADFDFDIDYAAWKVSFRKDDAENIKISRGEQNIFIWCLFMAVCERMLDGHISYQSNKYLYIDDPISSLDDNNAISVACDLAQLLRRAASRKDNNGAPAPIKVIFSSHHALFFNVMCNEIGRSKEGEPKIIHKRYFLHRPNGDSVYTLRTTEDTPYFHHVATSQNYSAPQIAEPESSIRSTLMLCVVLWRRRPLFLGTLKFPSALKLSTTRMIERSSTAPSTCSATANTPFTNRPKWETTTRTSFAAF